jgi:hypothetical protein
VLPICRECLSSSMLTPAEILAAPRKGDEVAGSGGFRKIRWRREGSTTGKSGPFRVLYLHMQTYAIVFLVLVYGKADRANISKADAKALASRASGLKAWAKQRHEEWLRQIRRS